MWGKDAMEKRLASFPHICAYCALRAILKPGTYGSQGTSLTVEEDVFPYHGWRRTRGAGDDKAVVANRVWGWR